MTTIPRPAALALLDTDPARAASIVQRAIEQELAEALPAYWRRRGRALTEVGTPWAAGAALACANHAILLDAERRGVSVLDVLEGASWE